MQHHKRMVQMKRVDCFKWDSNGSWPTSHSKPVVRALLLQKKSCKLKRSSKYSSGRCKKLLDSKKKGLWSVIVSQRNWNYSWKAPIILCGAHLRFFLFNLEHFSIFWTGYTWNESIYFASPARILYRTSHVQKGKHLTLKVHETRAYQQTTWRHSHWNQGLAFCKTKATLSSYGSFFSRRTIKASALKCEKKKGESDLWL